MTKPRFALLGAAGYVAPRHMKAIKDVGGELVAACDPHDSVGILDRYAPDCAFFTEIERFDRHLEKLRRKGEGIDYLSICTPNYLHDAHCRLALRLGASAICEKPLVTSPWNLDQLAQIESESEGRVYTVLQLRQHPIAAKIKSIPAEELEWLRNPLTDEAMLTYVTPRGKWYERSWKGDREKSGGLVMNIGVHLIDLMVHCFGPYRDVQVTDSEPDEVTGCLHFESVDVWFCLSTRGEKSRSFKVGDSTFAFDSGFEDLHTKVYEEILAGRGTGIEDVREAIELAYEISRHGRQA